MCGIAGLLESSPGLRGESLERARILASCLRHRGPDAEGAWAEEDGSAALGHRRLAVVDLSAAGRQPMASPCGRYVLVYNGEIYGFQGLRRELASQGNRFRGHGDTEVLLAALVTWGVKEALERVDGMFAFALWDRRCRRLVIARDRMGQKPLLYAFTGTGFIFASELQALRAVPGLDAEPDRGSLALLLRRGSIAGRHTILRGVSRLPPGTWAAVDLADLEAGRKALEACHYWSLREVFEAGARDPFPGPPEAAREELHLRLRHAVRRTGHADVPLGAFLSGGVDSSLVVALLQEVAAEPVQTFTIGFNNPAFDEADAAAAVARHLGCRHRSWRLREEDALAVVPRLPEIYDEPFADPSQIPTVLLSRMTRRHVTVALSGDGGDELFGGYANHRLLLRLARLARLPSPLTAIAGAALRRLPAGSAGGSGLRGRPLERLRRLGDFLAACRTLDEMHLRLLSTWKHPAGLVRGGDEPAVLLNSPKRWPDIRHPTGRAMALDALTYLPEDILVKVDRAAMAVSLETRMPLLDRRVVELAARLPVEMNLADPRGKGLLRAILKHYLPAGLVDRPKRGFSVPLDAWLRGALRDWAEALLVPERLDREGYLVPEPIWEKWREHQEGRNDWAGYLWPVLMFQAWYERWRR